MPTYLLQFTVESCLTKTTDVTINRDGVGVTFLFSKRQTNDKYVRTQTKLEAANKRLRSKHLQTSCRLFLTR